MNMINVLIVDDDLATVEVIRDSMDWKSLGINDVYTAYNVSGAKKVINKKNIDIIISDIEMPQASGLDLLRWVREQKNDCEFLLLTCHESFSYATDAIQYDAAAYLTKPFDLEIMKLNLQKIINKLIKKRNLQNNSDYELWMNKNIRFMKLDFWKQLLEGNFQSEEKIHEELKERHLEISLDESFCLIYVKVSNTENDIDRYNKAVYEDTLEKLISETVCGTVKNDSVVKYHNDNNLRFLIVISARHKDTLKARCNELLSICKEHFSSIITCCISDEHKLTELSLSKQKLEKLFYYNVNINNRVFYEYEVEILDTKDIQILDMNKISEFIREKNKTQVLNYLKQTFHELSVLKRMNLYSLYLMKQEIMQVVYADLMQKGIQATKLFHDEFSIGISNRALDSTIDMIRWVNYLLEKTFSYEKEIEKSSTIINKINQYIHDNYSENISRSKIAEEFFLTPEYLAKLYKKKTGITIKTYINDYRIEKAKELLRTSDMNISEIAVAVGFDNFSYFSTLFKKATGISPKDYKDELEA
jgi:two-component system response regulator YesN